MARLSDRVCFVPCGCGIVKYLNAAALDSMDAEAFRHQSPYPWVAPAGLLNDQGFRELLANLPPVSRFERVFDKQRKHGQTPHNRFALEWESKLELPPPWEEFIGELRSGIYREFLARMLQVDVRLRFHWHYTPRGCSVSPHCDARRKLGSHIFYFNDADAWDPEWGGQTLVLDDHGRLHRDSNPEFDAFDCVATSEVAGNNSFLFLRRGNSWHGVREIQAPEGEFRKVFIVIFEKLGMGSRVIRRLGSPNASRP